MEMPTVEVNGQECVGMIEIPALGLKLPIISEWSDAKLKKATLPVQWLRVFKEHDHCRT